MPFPVALHWQSHAHLNRFEVTFSGLDWVSNFEKNRWFLVLRVKVPSNNELNKLLHISNAVVQDYGQPPLYVEPTLKSIPKQKRPRVGSLGKQNYSLKISDLYNEQILIAAAVVELKNDWDTMQDRSNVFHFSIAWTLEPPDEGLIQSTKDLVTNHMADAHKIKVKVEDIKAKIGNVVTSIHLLSQVGESKGLFGF